MAYSLFIKAIKRKLLAHQPILSYVHYMLSQFHFWCAMFLLYTLSKCARRLKESAYRYIMMYCVYILNWSDILIMYTFLLFCIILINTCNLFHPYIRVDLFDLYSGNILCSMTEHINYLAHLIKFYILSDGVVILKEKL